jgi:tetratricopeptide (TPR) repeat protein
MNLRLGLILAGALAIGAVGCASGGGGGGTTTSQSPGIAGEALAQGERPRQNSMTRAAADALENAQELIADAEEAGTDVSAAEAEARPFYETALESAEQAIAADSTNPLPWYQAGLAYMGLDRYVDADRMLDRAEELRPIYQIELEPLREQTWINLFNEAQPALNAGQYDEAARIFEQADAMYERRPEVKIVLGQIYQALDRNEEAVELFRESITIIESGQIEQVDSVTAAQWQGHAETLPLAIADALIAAENYGEASQQLRRLLAEDPDNVVLARNLASVFIRMEQPDSAAVIYDELLRRPNLTGGDYYQIGVGLYNMDDYDGAADAFSDAVSAASMNRDAAEMWARSVQLAMPDAVEGEEADLAAVEEQRDAAERWMELDPYNRNAHLIAAQAANRLGDEDRARELVQAIENLPVVVDNLQLRLTPGGGATVFGQVMNMTRPAGSTITVEMTFYGTGGQAIGTETTTVELPGQEASQALQVEFESDQEVTGYTYTIGGLGG